MADGGSAINWFLRKSSFGMCFPGGASSSRFVVPVRIMQLLRWPAGKAVPPGYDFPIDNTTAGPMLALGVAETCAAVGYNFDVSCSSEVYPHVLISYDGGYQWSCLSDTIFAVARLHAAYAVYSSSESGTEAAKAAPCDLICVIGGKDGLPGPTYGQPTRDVFCTRDGGRGSLTFPLPMDVVDGAAFVHGDYLFVAGGIRSAGPYGALRAPIDPTTCALSGPWEGVQEEESQSSLWLHNSTLQWPVTFPDLTLQGWNGSCSAWCQPWIGRDAVSFVSFGVLSAPLPSPKAYSLAPLVQALPRASMAFSKGGSVWRPTKLLLPQSTLASGSPQRVFRLRGPLSHPLSTVHLPWEHRRVMLAAAGGSLSSSDNDGTDWSTIGSVVGPRNASIPAPDSSMPAPFLLGVGQDSSHNSTPTLLAFDPATNHTYIGYTRQCVIDCSQIGLPGHYISTPCVDNPWTPPTCTPCTVCNTSISFAILPCKGEQNTVCSPFNPSFLPGPTASPSSAAVPVPSGLPGALEGSPWVEPLLYTALLALWLLFVWASGGGRVLAARRGDASDRKDGTLGSVSSWWSGWASTPSPTPAMLVGLLASFAYRFIDLSLLLLALRLAGINEGARVALAAAGLLGLVFSSVAFALAAVRFGATRKAWLKARGAWVRGLRALGPAPDPPMAREEDRLTIEEDKRIQLLQSATTAFALHPLSCLWLDVHMCRAIAMAQATNKALALANIGQSGVQNGSTGSLSQWGSSDSLHTASLSSSWAVIQVLCSDAVHVLTCMIGAGATVGHGGAWAAVYAGLSLLPLGCSLFAAWTFLPVYSMRPRVPPASCTNPLALHTEALQSHLERARLPSLGSIPGLTPGSSASSGSPVVDVDVPPAASLGQHSARNTSDPAAAASHRQPAPPSLQYGAAPAAFTRLGVFPAAAVPPTEVDDQSSIAGHSSQVSQHIVTATGARYMGPYNHYTLEGLMERASELEPHEAVSEGVLAQQAAVAAVEDVQPAVAPDGLPLPVVQADGWQQLTGALHYGSSTGRVQSPRALVDSASSAPVPGPSLWRYTEAPLPARAVGQREGR